MARKKKVEEREVDGTVVLFTALMLILLSFFIMMNTMAVFDERKVRLAMGSLLGEFGPLSGGMVGRVNTAESGLDLGPYPNVDPQAISKELARIKVDRKVDGNVAVELRGQDLALVIDGQLLIGADPAQASAEVRAVLDRIGDLLLKTKKEIRIEGHAAEQLAASDQLDDELSWAESLRWAQNVANYYCQQLPEDQLIVAGYGATRPLSSNDNLQGWLNNRRVEIVVVDGADDPALRFRSHSVEMGRFLFERHDERGKTWYEKK